MPSASTLWLPNLSPSLEGNPVRGRPLLGGGRFSFRDMRSAPPC
jgi:hypothetical protein